MEEVLALNGLPLSEYLRVRDLASLGACGRSSRAFSQQAVGRRKRAFVASRASRNWIATRRPSVSRHRDAEFNPEPYESYGRADDAGFDEARGYLDESLRGRFPTEEAFHDAIAGWCGGWASFLDARESCAVARLDAPKKRPGQMSATGRPIGSGVQPVLLFDLFRDGKHIWTGVNPLRADAYGLMFRNIWGASSRPVRRPLYVALLPLSTKTPGDPVDDHYMHDFFYGPIPRRYLLSTGVADTSSYRLRATVVSPSCDETLIIASRAFVPAEVLKSEAMEEYCGGGAKCAEFSRADLRRTEKLVDMGSADCYHARPENKRGRRSKCQLEMHFYHDKRGGEGEERFHVWAKASFAHDAVLDLLARSAPGEAGRQRHTPNKRKASE